MNYFTHWLPFFENSFFISRLHQMRIILYLNTATKKTLPAPQKNCSVCWISNLSYASQHSILYFQFFKEECSLKCQLQHPEILITSPEGKDSSFPPQTPWESCLVLGPELSTVFRAHSATHSTILASHPPLNHPCNSSSLPVSLPAKPA